MCGIGGVLGRPTEGFAAFMQDALRHRGPDGQVSWAEGGIILTQTRLAIIDVSDEGTQPFHSRDGRFTVIYNGEIYNHQELRTRHALAAPPCDGAMLPELWAKLGPACLSELRGMFAICVFDRLDRRMWLAVDPLGMKPLYVRRRPAEVAFSSEAMPLAQHFGDSAPEDGAQAIFEAWGCLPPNRSGIAAIERLVPGEVREFDGNGHEVARSEIPLDRWKRGETSWRDVVDAFVESVDLHLMADVPLGLMLSEGVDSAAVAWAAAEAGRKLDCFTLDFLGSPGEGAGAARIAEAYGHSHHVLGADPDVESLVDDYLTHVDRPTCDGLNVLLVSNAIRAAGIKVALAGTGGDEVLAGYGHHRSRWVLGDKASRSARSSARAGLRFVSSGRGIGPFGLRQLGPRANEKLLAGLHGVARGVLSADPQKRVAAYRAQHPDYADLEVGFAGPRFEDLAPDLGVGLFTAAEWKYYLGPMLLADADVFSMAAGLEARLPFVDVGVIAAALQVQDRSAGKGGFVQATGDALLARIAVRPKTGFELPMGRWLRALHVGSDPRAGTRALTHVREAPRRSELGEWKGLVWSSWASRLDSYGDGPGSDVREAFG